MANNPSDILVHDGEDSEIVTLVTRHILTMKPSPEALGIGGSRGRRTSDEKSDFDFFILLPSEGFFDRLAVLVEHLKKLGPPIAFKGPHFVEGFGFKISVILASTSTIDFFANSRETLDQNPMRASTQILFDSTGHYSNFIRDAGLQWNEESMYESLVLSLAFDYLDELIKIRKYLERKDLPPLLYRISKLRRTMVALERLATTQIVTSSHDSDKNLRITMGSSYVENLLETVSTFSLWSTARTVLSIRRRIIKLFENDFSNSISVAYLEEEKTIFEQIAKHSALNVTVRSLSEDGISEIVARRGVIALVRQMCSFYSTAGMRFTELDPLSTRPLAKSITVDRVEFAQSLIAMLDQQGIKPYEPFSIHNTEEGVRLCIPPIVERWPDGCLIVDGMHRLFVACQQKRKAVTVLEIDCTGLPDRACVAGTWSDVLITSDRRPLETILPRAERALLRPISFLARSALLLYRDSMSLKEQIDLYAAHESEADYE